MDRARDFYVEKAGFEVDIDHMVSDEVRFVQLTPPGEVGELQIFDEGAYRPAREGEDLDYVGFVFFSDPDGNRWRVQQIPARD
jgi:catechol 2,3-dioxygenase-like lactoylglutathione lyase family enzyme